MRTTLVPHAVILMFSALMTCLVARSALHSGAFYFLLYNADALYIPAFVDDLLNHSDALSGWRFSPAPSFFPDMPIYAAALLAGRGFRVAIILYAGLQTSLFLEACWALATVAGLRARGAFLSIVMTLLAVCFCRFFITGNANPDSNDVFWLSPMVSQGCHFGAVLCSVWGLVLLTIALQGSAVAAVGLGALILATGCSDLFYLVWFCGPACGVLIFARRNRRTALALAAMIVGLSLLLWALQRIFNSTLALYHGDEATAGFFIRYLFDSGRENAVHVLIILLPALALSVLASIRLFMVGDARALIAGFLALSPIACVGAGLIWGLFGTIAIPRYTLPVLFMTILGGAFVAAEVLETREIRLPKGGAVAAAVPFLSLLFLLPTLRDYPSRLPHPPELDCFSKDRPSAGLADYWSARTLTLFSDERLQVEPLSQDARPVWWISNRNWFTRDFNKPDKMPRYSFIYLRGLDPAAAEARFGRASSWESCLGGEVWRYEDAAELTSRFRAAYAASDAGK